MVPFLFEGSLKAFFLIRWLFAGLGDRPFHTKKGSACPLRKRHKVRSTFPDQKCDRTHILNQRSPFSFHSWRSPHHL
ncbi:hypothetical protein [Microcoleus vaginatus]|uniref:hypothetical protein n=1 Tax=Microcoleus vaginatus TaxID=119532 RepID=UPI001F619CA0